MLQNQNIKLAAHPINWSNDDFHELGGDISLETCLSEINASGYSGTELGHKFPTEIKALIAILEKYNLNLASGWHSTYLLENDLNAECETFSKQVNFLKQAGAKVAIVSECSRRVFNNRNSVLDYRKDKNSLNTSDWQRLGKGLDKLNSRS